MGLSSYTIYTTTIVAYGERLQNERLLNPYIHDYEIPTNKGNKYLYASCKNLITNESELVRIDMDLLLHVHSSGQCNLKKESL